MNRFCPICSCSEKTFLYKQNFHNKVISLMDNYDVVVCDSCGFVYADNIPSQSEFDSYYAAMSRYEFSHNDGIFSKSYIDHARGIIDFLIPHISNKKARILDIGCSTGCLLSLFKERGYSNLIGVDPSPSCAETVIKRYGIETVASTISTFEPNENEFLITLTSSNYLAKQVNLKKLNALPYATHIFEAEVVGEFKPEKYPTDKFLELRKNSQIIFIKNDLFFQNPFVC